MAKSIVRTPRTITTMDEGGSEVIKRITQEDYDERFYHDTVTGRYFPSVSYVLSVGLPTEPHLIEWIASKGTEEARRIKVEAGARGTRVHKYVEDMMNNLSIPSADLTLQEKRCLLGFMNFWGDFKPDVSHLEAQFISEKYEVGGTIDFLGKLQVFDNETPWIIDWKTSKSAQLSHKVQVSVYAKCLGIPKAGLVTLGNTTKKRYTFTEVNVEEYFTYFLAAQQIFKMKFPNASPTVETFPESFSLSFS